MERDPALPTAATTVKQLAAMAILEDLSHAELGIYLRLVAAGPKRTKRTLSNASLWHNARTCGIALRKLEEKDFIRITYDDGAGERLIEVLR